MGMFDIIKLECVCPYCGQKNLMDFQTKDLECELINYVPGDKVSEYYRDDIEIEIYTGCHSTKCQEIADKVSIIWQGLSSGFGSLFYAKVKLVNGILQNEVYDIITEPYYTEEYIEKYRSKWEGIYKPRIGIKDGH